MRPRFERLKHLFETDWDLRKRMGFDKLATSDQLDQAFLRRRLYAYDQSRSGPRSDDPASSGRAEPGDPGARYREVSDDPASSGRAEPGDPGARYREVAVRRFVQGDPESSQVGLDLLAALPLRDDEKVFVLGLSPSFLVLPDAPSGGRHVDAIRRLAMRFEKAGIEDLEPIAKIGEREFGERLQSPLEKMVRRFEAGLESVFLLKGEEGEDGGHKVRAFVRLWQLRPSAVRALRTGEIRRGSQIDDAHLVDHPSLAAGVYVTMVYSDSPLTGAAVIAWVTSHVRIRYPGRRVFTRPVTEHSYRVLRRLRAQRLDVPGSEIWDVGEIPD